MVRLREFYGLLLLVSVLSSCQFTYKIKTGQEAYDVKQYSLAAEMLAEEFRKSGSAPDRAYLAYLAGRSYDEMHQPEQAAYWYNQSGENGGDQQAYDAYAAALRRLERYDEAILVYERSRNDYGDDLKYQSLIAQCRQAQLWKANAPESPYEVRFVSLNSPASDFAPYVIGKNQIVFTSDRPVSRTDEIYKWTGRAFSEIYVSDFEGYNIRPFDERITSDHNDGTIALSSDRNMLIFSRCYSTDAAEDAHCKLLVAYRDDRGQWTEPEVLPFVQGPVNFGHPALAENDSTLFFASDEPSGMGGYDLYFSRLGPDGWSAPVSLGERINTQGNEQFPTLHKDTLYFSSDYLPGMGGLDIFKTYLRTDGTWSPPLNLKPPINSGWDDFSYVVDTFASRAERELQKGFFCSSREGGAGNDDIYGFTLYEPEEPDSADLAGMQGTEEENIRYQLFLAIRVVEPVFADPNDPNSPRKGKRPLSRARVLVGEGMQMQSFSTDEEGYLILEVSYENTYNIQARFRGFLNKKVTFDGRSVEKDPSEPVKTVNLEIMLEPIFRGVEIVLDNIYYDLDKWEIRDDAKPSLDTLAKILLDNPQIRIEMGSHTDCRADDAYNLELSQKRAQSAVDYLIAAGVKPERLTAKGYGETQFAVNCLCEECTEEQHQANRRTTFKIVE